MPHKIYVGNYPLSFVEDDVLNLFQDFEGVELAGFFKNNNKCYSFLHCIDESQLIEIVANLHDIDVCGRNLIVRAADRNLQKRIKQSIDKHGAVNVHPKNTCDVNNSASVYGNNGTFGQSEAGASREFSSPQMGNSYSKNVYPKKYETDANAVHSTTSNSYQNSGRFSSKNYESHDYSSHISESNYPSQQNSRYAQNSFSGGREARGSSSYYQNFSEPENKKNYSDINPQAMSRNYSSHISESNYPSQQNSRYAQNSLGGNREARGSRSYHRNFSEPENEKHDSDINPQETFSKSKTDESGPYKTINERFESYKKNSPHNRVGSSVAGHRMTSSREEYQTRNRNASESSLDTVHNQPHSQEYENLSFVSVINFPLHLPTRDLYQLFADFNPIKVFIVCNEPRTDKTPTEAVVCFEHEKEATDAILTLDNTVYRGRVLIVTDAVDMSLVSELLSFG